jgi:hypothetical protein
MWGRLSLAANSIAFCRIVAEFIVDETDIECRASMSFLLADKKMNRLKLLQYPIPS